jgi:osmotically-inducible protein OsmY
MARPIRAAALMSVGGVAAALADPVSGARRRHMLRDRSIAAVRRLRDRGERSAGGALHRRVGRMRAWQAAHQSSDGAVDDATLADRVRSEAFRDLSVTPHEANVGVADGIVTLRGQLPGHAEIDELVARVRTVPGVRGVENLVHTAGEPAPGPGRA